MPLERYRRDTTFSCRTLSLIPYGLKAVLNLPKSGHSVFREDQNYRVYFIRQKNALHQTKNRTAAGSQVNFMISFGPT